MSPPSLGAPSALISYLPCPLIPSASSSTTTTCSFSSSSASSSAQPASAPPASASASAKPAFTKPIELLVPPATVPLLFAHRQWRAGLLLSDFLLSSSPSPAPSSSGDEDAAFGAVSVRGKRVLELGAGTGLPSLCAARAGAEVVVCTDYDEASLISRLRENIARNIEGQGEGEGKGKGRVKGRVKVAGHTWGKATDDLLDFFPATSGKKEGAELVLLADCLWDPLSHPSLLSTLTSLLSRSASARILVVSGLHTGRDVLLGFQRRAKRAGLVLRPIGEEGWPGLEEEEEKGWEGGEEEGERRREMLELGLAPDAEDTSVSPLPSSPPVVPSSLPLSPSPPAPDAPPERILAHTHRLSGARRRWQDAERPEERKEVGGVRERNRWITVWSLGWGEGMY